MRKIIFFICLIFLTSCDQAPPESIDSKTTTEVLQTSGNYKIQTPLNESPIRGIYTDTDAYIDYDAMETELLDITKEFLNPKDLFYKPGEVLTAKDSYELLGRESSNNPKGLNPKDNGKPKESPIFINTIIEEDFYKKDANNKEKLDTIAFGFGIDTTYKFAEDKDPIKITDEQIKEFITKNTSNKMDEYIKNVKKIEDVNIICAFYKLPNDPNKPGSYFTYGMINKDEDHLEDVKQKNIKYENYPDYSIDEPINKLVIEFTNQLNEYFISKVGVIALAKYEDNKIQELNIEVIVSYASEIEIESLIYYIKDNLDQGLQSLPKLEIIIKSPTDEVYSIISYENGKLKTEYVS